MAAIGAISSKIFAARTFRAFGFRQALWAGSLVSIALVAVNAAFTPATPTALIMGLLLVGVLRSLCFTGVNAMVFADVPERETSQATAINAVCQQVSLATEVALGGDVLDLAASRHGGEIALRDFHLAFLAVAAVASLAALSFGRLPPAE